MSRSPVMTTQPALLPKLRFPEYRDAPMWTSKPMSDVYSFKGNNSLSRDKLNYEHGVVKNIHYGDIHTKFSTHFDIAKELVPYVNPTEPLEALKDENFCVEGDIIFADASEDLADIGKTIEIVSLNGERVLSGLHTILARQKSDDLFRGFAGHLFKAKRLRTQIQKESQGAKVLGLSGGRLAKIEVPFPSPAEQQKIAECLTTLDEVIAAQSQKLDALKTHKKGLLQQLFPREGETLPRLRFPEFQDAPEWLSSSVGELVESGDLFPPKDGNHGSLHPKSSDYVASGIPFIMASDLNGGSIDIENCHFISKELADSLQKGFAKEGDVLLSHKGTVGEVAVVKKIKTPYLMLTPQVTYYRVKDRRKLVDDFLAQFFVSDAFQSNLLKVSGGGTRAYIGITEQAKLNVQLPKNVAEQQRVAACLTSVDDLITTQSAKLESLKTHKQGLMQQLFPPLEVE